VAIVSRISDTFVQEKRAESRQNRRVFNRCGMRSRLLRRSGKTRQANCCLHAALIQSALGASHARATALQARYHRAKRHRGHKKAVVAVGHQILEIADYIMRDGVTYDELGPDYVEWRHADRAIRRHARQPRPSGSMSRSRRPRDSNTGIGRPHFLSRTQSSRRMIFEFLVAFVVQRTGSLLPLLPAVLVLAGCSRPASQPPSDARNAHQRDGEWLSDRTVEAGLEFVHVNGMSGRFYFPEMMGPGVALFDYDNDGDPDVYFVQGQPLGKDTPNLTGRLFRNDLQIHEDGATSLHFADVTVASGIVSRGYGMGVAAGDIDNDGCVDLYLTAFGRNQMFRNNCNGTFTDVSARSRTDDQGWSVSASFFDFDRDGWLDLYVGHYVTYRIESATDCFNVSGKRDYCSPNAFRPEPSRLYRNNHNGTFTDVTASAGLAGDFGPGLGVVCGDFDEDGWLDLFVANDGQADQLWINQRNGTFKNLGLPSGSALTASGKATGSMGVDAADFNGDGHEDLLITTLVGEGASLFLNNIHRGVASFDDRATVSGLRPASLPNTGFGTAAFDVDNDGWLDVLVVNGAVRTIEAQARANDPFPLRQRKQLFRNLGDARFEDVSRQASAALDPLEVSRGAAFGDIDNDGDIDVVVANNNQRARLLINNVGNRSHWVGLRLVGAHGRDMLGARVAILADAPDASGTVPTVWRRARTDGSYASANDPRVLAGLGASRKPPSVRVTWPDGKTEEWNAVSIDRYTTLREGGSQ
jgi:hypothetical protein